MQALRICLLLCGFSLIGISSSEAQTNAAQPSFSAAVGAINFDVDGTATTLGISGRGAAALTSRVAVEGNFSWARDEVSGTSDLWVAEAHVQYFWRAGSRLRPYAGGGAGVFINQGELSTDGSLTLSAAGGARIDLTDRVAALGEFRIRGVGLEFTGSFVEIWGGVTFRLGR